MQLIKKELLDTLQKEGLLQVVPVKHERTWEYFEEQYRSAFCVLLKVAKQKQYKTNALFRPFLFIMRHSLELFLKRLISETETPWDSYGYTHNLENLSQMTIGIDVKEFLRSFDCLACDSEGDCWRYLSDRNGNFYFDGKSIEAFDACRYYGVLFHDNLITDDIVDKRLLWELTFHPLENNTLGMVATQYDNAIGVLLFAIKNKQVSINDIYLPLLFLLRHSLELKLKFGIMELGDIFDIETRPNLSRMHSVKELYDKLSSHINPAIEAIEGVEELYKQSKNLAEVTCQYTSQIASLDTHSYHFRFPVDQKGFISNFIPTSDCISRILELYWTSDSFLCFAVDVLTEMGVLPIGDDKLKEYYD